MSIRQVPLTVANFADGALATEVDEKIAEVVERFRKAENGDIELSSDKAAITIKLYVERDPSVGGFRCSFDEPSMKLPAKVRSGTVAVERDGILVVSTDSEPEQLRLTTPSTSNN